MYTITFYSFKGGVGRTMALVNVGLELVRRGRRVLLVDFDLEAPGLTTYDALRQQAEHPGIVEYVTEYMRTKESPEVTRFIYPVDLARVGSRHQKRKVHKRLPGADYRESTGQLWVMPSGKGDAAYGSALAAINWNSLYEQQDGYLFLEDTKAQWQQFFKPDYVLIDSRTGHTDVGGICTRQLADAVVMLFTPNEQNRVGLRDVSSAIRAEEKANGRRIAMHLVMSNVPRLDDEEGILRRHVNQFLETLKFQSLAGVIDRYDSLMHLDQRVFALERPRSRLAKQYRRLVHRLIVQNPEDREGVLVQLDRFRHESGFIGREGGGRRITGVHLRPHPAKLSSELLPAPEEIVVNRPGRSGRLVMFSEHLRDRLQRITDAFAEDQEILLRVAEIHSEVSNFETAGALLDQVIRQGENPQALLLRSRVSFQLGHKDQAIEDLVKLIRLETIREDLVVEAMRDLHRLDPQRLVKEISPERVEPFSPAAKAEVAGLLASPTDGFLRAVSLLRNAVQEMKDEGRSLLIRHQLSTYLLYRQDWEAVIELWRGQTNFPTRRYKAMGLFHEVLAHWGKSGEMPEGECRQIVELTRPPSACDSHAPDCQALALVYWRLGDSGQAKEYVQKALHRIARRVTPDLSYWRCLEVPPATFREDCRQILRLIDGERLHPTVFAERRLS